MKNRFTIDGLLSAVSRDVKLADYRPIANIGAGVALAKSKKAVKAKQYKPNRYAGFPDFCARMGLPRPTAEFRFHSTRKWRADWCWPEHKLILECEGGIFINGGHSRGSGRTRDHEKFSEAAALGFRLIFAQPRTLQTTATADLIRRALAWHKIL